MKANSKKTREQKQKNHIDRFFTEEHQRLLYAEISENANYISRQIVALFLWSLSMHGYGEKRLNEMFGWFLDTLRMPDELMGKKIGSDDVMYHLHRAYGIDLSRLDMQFVSYDDYIAGMEKTSVK